MFAASTMGWPEAFALAVFFLAAASVLAGGFDALVEFIRAFRGR